MSCVSENFVSKKFMHKRGEEEGLSRFCFEVFLSHIIDKIRKGTFLRCVSENSDSKKFMHKRGVEEGLSRFCFEVLLSHFIEKIRKGTLLLYVPEKFPVAKTSENKRGKGEEATIKIFHRNFFVS